MRTRLLACLTVLLLVATSALSGQATPPQQAPPQTPPPTATPGPQGPRSTFKGAVNLILVDVNVRDKNGAPIKGLKQSDFELLEGGKSQDITTFTYEEIAPNIKQAIITSSMLANAGAEKGAVPVTLVPPPKPVPTPAGTPAEDKPTPAVVDAANGPLTTESVAGHRVWVLLFDTSSMQPEDIQKSADSAVKWATEKMSSSDLVAIAAISSTLQILQDFTNDKAKVMAVLQAFAAADGTAFADVDASTMSTDEATNTATAADATTVDASAQELETFNNDMRLRGLKTICDNMLSIQEHKAILYFSSGMQRNGTDNQIELRSAVASCERANTSLNPVDSRGLVAVVAGGNGRSGSRSGVGAFSGSNVAAQFTQLAQQQETLQAMAADTGGTAFVDSNDFGEAFDKVEKDISSYYILGYTSSNPKQDGQFRKIEVRVNPKINAKIQAREGYYADRDFAHTGRTDRETQLQEQLMMAIPATDVPLFVTAGYFRLPTALVAQACPGSQYGPGGGGRGGRGGGAGGGGGRGGGPGGAAFVPTCYYVPISLSVPGEALPPSQTNDFLDVRGYIRDERGNEFAKIKDTLNIPPAAKDSLAAKQVLYQTGATLPPGHYTAKIIVRENASGQMGTFEMPIVVPELNRAPVKVSSVIMSTQLKDATGRKTLSPLVHDNMEIVPNLTHVVNQTQKLYFYYEVYDPGVTAADTQPHVRTSLAFYRGSVKVYETPVVERTALDALDRKAEIFEFEVGADNFKPGLYTCQVNIIDAVAGQVAFPRLQLYVRAPDKNDKTAGR
jgi:VWFA-related protein